MLRGRETSCGGFAIYRRRQTYCRPTLSMVSETRRFRPPDQKIGGFGNGRGGSRLKTKNSFNQNGGSYLIRG